MRVISDLPTGWHSQHDAPVTASAVVSDSSTFVGFREATITITNTDTNTRYYQVMHDVAIPQEGTYTMSWFVRSDNPAGIAGLCDTLVEYWTQGFGMNLGGEPSLDFATNPTATWSRVTRTFTTLPNTRQLQVYISCDAQAASTYSWVLAAPQVELGTIASSPILTTGTAATREADILTLTTSDLQITDQGTILVDIAAPHEAQAEQRTALAIATNAGTIDLSLFHANAAWNFFTGMAGGGLSGNAAGPHRIGYRFDAQSAAFVVDNVLSFGTGRPPLIVTGTLTVLGALNDGTEALFGAVTRLRTWSTPLDDASFAN